MSPDKTELLEMHEIELAQSVCRWCTQVLDTYMCIQVRLSTGSYVQLRVELTVSMSILAAVSTSLEF